MTQSKLKFKTTSSGFDLTTFIPQRIPGNVRQTLDVALHQEVLGEKQGQEGSAILKTISHTKKTTHSANEAKNIDMGIKPKNLVFCQPC